MNRRSFLTGAASAALASALPAWSVASVGGTVTGRWAHVALPYAISRAEIKRMMYLRAYGGGCLLEYDPERGSPEAFANVDFAKIEARVLSHLDKPGLDPYDPFTVEQGASNDDVPSTILRRHVARDT